MGIRFLILVIILIVLLAWSCRRRIVPRRTPYASQSDKHTVIVGAGVIGLCAAYHLARRRAGKGRLTIIDAAHGPMQAASASNTGCLLFIKHPDIMSELGSYCLSSWEQLAKFDAKFRKETGYRARANYTVEQKTGIAAESSSFCDVPSWVRWNSDWDLCVLPDSGRSSTITATSLARWLYNECLALGVDFIFDVVCDEASLTSHGKIESVGYKTIEKERHVLQCDQLLIAAGPWSQDVLTSLFPSSSAILQLIPDAGDWILLELECPENDESARTCLMFNSVVGHKLEMTGRNDGTIWITGPRNNQAKLPQPTTSADPSPAAIKLLQDHARHFVKAPVRSTSQGRSFRPTTCSDLPIMTQLPVSALTSHASGRDGDDTISGVYLSTGHGTSGVTLSFGSGKLMSQLLDDALTDIDISLYALPA